MTEWDADAYARESSLQEAMARKALAGLELAGDERVLDVGSGDGRVTARLARLVPGGSVVGVDPSRAMVEHASKTFSPAHPNLRFAVADARNLPEGEFDAVVSFNALHWVPELGDAFRAICATLRPGGRAFLRFVPEGRRRSLEDAIEDVRESPAWSGHFDGFRRPFVHPTPDEARALAGAAGFVVDRLAVEDEAWDFRDRDAFVAFARATFVEWTGRLPEAARDPFIFAVLDRYAAIIADGPGEHSTFRFYQIDLALTADGRPR